MPECWWQDSYSWIQKCMSYLDLRKRNKLLIHDNGQLKSSFSLQCPFSLRPLSARISLFASVFLSASISLFLCIYCFCSFAFLYNSQFLVTAISLSIETSSMFVSASWVQKLNQIPHGQTSELAFVFYVLRKPQAEWSSMANDARRPSEYHHYYETKSALQDHF